MAKFLVRRFTGTTNRTLIVDAEDYLDAVKLGADNMLGQNYYAEDQDFEVWEMEEEPTKFRIISQHIPREVVPESEPA